MIEKNIRIEKTGKIISGEFKNWFIFIKDDKKDSGGYLVLVFDNFVRNLSKKEFDFWAEDLDSLYEMQKEAQWAIDWMPAPNS